MRALETDIQTIVTLYPLLREYFLNNKAFLDLADENNRDGSKDITCKHRARLMDMVRLASAAPTLRLVVLSVS